jgi:hypothetical protein
MGASGRYTVRSEYGDFGSIALSEAVREIPGNQGPLGLSLSPWLVRGVKPELGETR